MISLAWLASQIAPAWAARYLAAGVPALVLLSAAGFAHAGRLGLAGLAIVAVLWAVHGAPDEKSNVRDVAEAIAPSLHPGDLVVATQPEQVSVLDYYLPDGVRFGTLTGPVEDPGVTDWRDGVERLEATSAPRDATNSCAMSSASAASGSRSSCPRSPRSTAGARRGRRLCGCGPRSGCRRSRTIRACRSSRSSRPIRSR